MLLIKMRLFFKQSKLLCLALTILLVALLTSCASRIASSKDATSKETKIEQTVKTSEVLEDFHVRLPESIRLNEAFEMRITTIGSKGTKPFFEDGDALQVTWVSDVGRLEPANAQLQGGIGSMQLSLTDLDDLKSSVSTVELTVTLKDLNQNLMTKTITLNIQ